ncbi:uncharacterized protein LOC132700420 [Cylas formicarius]|uniref:uncharacterized protein LOC132700420 n=1 Tax=Cylas formicarius TaxID=197179 RepID=UPI0029587D8A|nr:uncharacterized protein LOC132700420 [Cylas formicarius]
MTLCRIWVMRKLLQAWSCSMCTYSEFPNTTENIKLKAKKARVSKAHVKQVNTFIENNLDIVQYRDSIPCKYLNTKSIKQTRSLYLISPTVAESIGSHVMKAVRVQDEHVIAETNPGLGLITRYLLDQDVNKIHLYESCEEFQLSIKRLHADYLNRMEFYPRNFFHLSFYSRLDKYDNGNRVASLLRHVPAKRWLEGPAITVIGTMQNLKFLQFLITGIVMQTHLALFGRVQIFAIMSPKDYRALNSKKFLSHWSILFNVFMDYELLEKYDRRFFVPWQSDRKNGRTNSNGLEAGVLYLVKINMKKKLPLKGTEMLQFFYFTRRLLRSRRLRIIPLVEDWIPNCGLNLMAPKLKHEDYFDEMGIFTQFDELNPNQIVSLFKEIAASESYEKSSFVNLIEHQLMHRETIDTDLNKYLEEIITNELQNKDDLQ